jgi:hypothetical protein
VKSETLPSFWKLYWKLPERVRRAAQEAYRQFMVDPTHSGLHFHRLFNDPLYWSVRISRNHRAVGIVQGDTITWIWVGDHKAFDKAYPR